MFRRLALLTDRLLELYLHGETLRREPKDPKDFPTGMVSRLLKWHIPPPVPVTHDPERDRCLTQEDQVMAHWYSEADAFRPSINFEFCNALNAAIDKVVDELQHHFKRDLFRIAPAQDSNDHGSIALPKSGGEYLDIQSPHPASSLESAAYWENPAGLVFTWIGPLATVRKETNLSSTDLEVVRETLTRHGITYIPFAATERVLPRSIRPEEDYPDTWYEALFSYG